MPPANAASTVTNDRVVVTSDNHRIKLAIYNDRYATQMTMEITPQRALDLANDLLTFALRHLRREEMDARLHANHP
jgi:hypothetical protein